VDLRNEVLPRSFFFSVLRLDDNARETQEYQQLT